MDKYDAYHNEQALTLGGRLPSSLTVGARQGEAESGVEVWLITESGRSATTAGVRSALGDEPFDVGWRGGAQLDWPALIERAAADVPSITDLPVRDTQHRAA